MHVLLAQCFAHNIIKHQFLMWEDSVVVKNGSLVSSVYSDLGCFLRPV